MSHSDKHTAGKALHGIDRHLNMKEKKGTRQFYSISANICLKNKKNEITLGWNKSNWICLRVSFEMFHLYYNFKTSFKMFLISSETFSRVRLFVKVSIKDSIK